MRHVTPSRLVLAAATALFLAWAALGVLWPVEDYANRVHAYAESTNQIVRSMAIGITAYLAVLGLVLGWHVTRREAR